MQGRQAGVCNQSCKTGWVSGDGSGIQPLPQAPAGEAATWEQVARQRPEDLEWQEATDKIGKTVSEEHTDSRTNSVKPFAMLSSYSPLKKNKGVTEPLCK